MRRLFRRRSKKSLKGTWFPLLGFRGSGFVGDDKKRYESISVLQSVVNKRAECFGNAVPYVLDKDNNEPKGYEATQVRSLLKNPNALNSFQQLYRTTEVFRMIYGYCVWFTPRIAEDSTPSALMLIPPDKISIEVGSEYSLLSTRQPNVKVRIGGELTDITLDDLIIFNDIKTGFGGNPLLAQSRMTALANELNLLNDISEAQSSIVRHRGALGVLARDSKDETAPGVLEDQTKNIQEEYKKYGLSNSQWKIIITSAALRWIPLTMNVGDLKLIELEEVAAKKLCGVFDVPYELIPLSGHSTYENRKQAKLELYQDYVIPSSVGDADLITQKLKLKVKDLHVSFDYTHLPVFQEDQAAKAATIASISDAMVSLTGSNIISPDEARRELSNFIDIDPSKTGL